MHGKHGMKSHYFEPQNARFAELSLHILDSAEDKKYRRRERHKAELLEEITAMEARRRQGQQEKNPTPHQLGATRRARPVRKTLARTQAASGCRAHDRLPRQNSTLLLAAQRHHRQRSRPALVVGFIRHGRGHPSREVTSTTRETFGLRVARLALTA